MKWTPFFWCYAWYSDGHFYRAQVKGKNRRTKTITIRFDDSDYNVSGYAPHLLSLDELDIELND